MMQLFKRLPSVSTKELVAKLKQDIVLIDVRTAEEYRMGHIAEAQNVPLDQIGSYKQHRQEEIYVICQSGIRSKQAVHRLKRNGYQAVNVRGGMQQWHGSVTRGGK